ncbi:MAG TPA: hypothetical protein PKA64_14660 [Myxococcota bacterium]|nr:hypothetical protein [Myxococcota bacterium]
MIGAGWFADVGDAWSVAAARDVLLRCRWLDLDDAGTAWWGWLALGLVLWGAGGRWRLLGSRFACVAAGAMAGMSIAGGAGWVPEIGRDAVLMGWAGVGGAGALWVELGSRRIGMSLVGWMLGGVLAHAAWVFGTGGWAVTALGAAAALASAWTWDVAPRPWSAFVGAAVLCAALGLSTNGPAVVGLAAIGLGLQWASASRRDRLGAA